MQDDLISRAALLSGFDVRKVTEYDESGCGVDYKAVPVDVIEAAPAVDAEPVRHGVRTVYTIWHSSAWGEIHTKFECCGFDVNGSKKYNYCPNCGAKMYE